MVLLIVKKFMEWLKPLFSSPSMLLSLTFTSLRETSPVATHRIPILLDNFVTVSPGASLSTMNRVWLLRGLSLLPVWHKTMMKSAIGAFVMRVFVPFILHSSPCLAALVSTVVISVPRVGSVKAAADIWSPRHRGGR